MMDTIQWSRMALLSGRKIPTRSGSLLSCIRGFLALDDMQRRSAKIVVPECIEIARGRSIRTLTEAAIVALAAQIQAAQRKTT